jgi:lanosterol synthase
MARGKSGALEYTITYPDFVTRGICFTYAAMFALESLSLAGEVYDNSPSVRKACEFLVKHQMDDGGWGETYMVSNRKSSAR